MIHTKFSSCYEELQVLWEELEVAAEVKGRKLQEANEGQQFYRSVKDRDLWVEEVEKQLSSEDLGKVGGAAFSTHRHH